MSRLPAPLKKEQDKRIKIEYDPQLNVYWKVNPYNDEKVKICGYLLEDGTRCEEPLEKKCQHGLQTLMIPTTNDMLDVLTRVLDENKDENTDLQQCIALAKDIGQEQLMSLSSDIKMAYAMIYLHVKNTKGILGPKDMQFIMGILREIVHAKEVQARVEKSAKIDDSAVTSFILEIFGVLRTELPKDSYKKVIQQVYDRVILPRQAAKVIGNRVPTVEEIEVVDA